MKDSDCVDFLQWALPRLRRPWPGFRKVRGQVCKRVERRLRELGLPDARAYRDYLAAHGVEWPILDGLCTITISTFYRDVAVYDALCAAVLPELARAAAIHGRRALRVSSIGCASGEEPYTVTIAWRVAVAPAFPDMGLHVVATDVLDELLARARVGCYPASSLKLLPAAWRAQAFVQENDRYCLKSEFREGVEFRQQDVRFDFPQGTFDLILCRNLAFTYFDVATQRELLARFEHHLQSEGALVIGRREVLPPGNAAFTPWPALQPLGIYRAALDDRLKAAREQ